MNKQDEDKARKIANNYGSVTFIGLFSEKKYSESDCVKAILEMAAWKEQQVIEKACYWFEKNWTMYTYPSHLMFEDFKKYMEENK